MRNVSRALAGVTIALNYFPAWKALDATHAHTLEIVPVSNGGFLRIIGVPTESTELRLWFNNTRSRGVALILSTAGVVIFLSLVTARVARAKSNSAQESDQTNSSLGVGNLLATSC